MRVRTRRLPVGYQELEYIESTGTQYINTGYIPNVDTVMEGAFLHTEHTVDTPLFGVRTSNMANSYTFWAHPIEYTASQSNTMIFNGSSYKFPIGYHENTIETFYVSKSLMKCNDQEYTYTASSGTPNLPLILFGLSNGGSIDGRKFIGRVYYFNIYENGTAMRRLVPAKKMDTEVIGMYDLVNDEFYTNSGTGSFLGSQVRAIDSYKSSFSSFPVGFTKLTYIESTGTQYIDLNYICKNNVTIELDMMWTGTTTSAFETFVGFMYSASTVTPRIGIHKYNSSLMYGANATNTTGTALMANERMVLKADFTSGAQKLYKNGTQVGNTNTTTYDFTNNVCATYIFARNCPNSENYAKMRLYECKIYEGTTLVRHYVPVKQDNNGQAGLYDLITRQFRVNGGSGTFTQGTATNPGADYCQNGRVRRVLLPKEYQEVEYIESSGSQFINTGVVAEGILDISSRFSLVEIPSSYWVLSGARNGASNRCYIFGTADTPTYWACGYIGDLVASSVQVQAGTIYNGRIILGQNNQTMYLGNQTIFSRNNSTALSTGYNIYLFGLNYTGTMSATGKFRIYNYKLTKNNSLVRNFVPCYRKSDNVIGMYDIINKTFYTNAGSGTFTKGSNRNTLI